MVTGTVIVNLSDEYDTVSHKQLSIKVFYLTQDAKFTSLLRTMLNSRRFFVELNGQKIRGRI